MREIECQQEKTRESIGNGLLKVQLRRANEKRSSNVLSAYLFGGIDHE